MMEGVVRKKSRRVRMVLMRMAFIHHTASDTDRFSLEGQSHRGQSRYSPYETCKFFKWARGLPFSTDAPGGGGVNPPIHFHCVLHAKRGWVGPDSM